MNNPVQILYLEDNPRDEELVRAKVQQLAMPHELRVVRDRAAYESALAQTQVDLILSDYALPDYDGMAALALANEIQPGVPFILISGTLGDEQAVDCMLRGATDCVLKHRLSRLVPAVLRALAEADAHQKRRDAEVDLVQAKALLEAVVESVPLMIFLKEATDLRFVMFNRAGEELLGYDRKDLLGKNNLDLFPPEQAAHFMAKDREALVRQGVVDIPEETIQTARKGQRILHTRKVSVLGSDGITKYLLGISEDITERKQAEEERLLMQAQLIQSQKLEAIGTLASGVAHEINNPIMGVMNYAQLILDILGPDSSVAEYAIEIGKETERVATIVKNLLAFSRKENQADSPARVSDIVKDTLSLIRTVMQHDQVYLEVDVPPDLPKIRCRSQQIQQVLMNLLTNARDALNEKYPGRDENKKVIIRATVLADGGRLTTLSGPMVSEVEPVEERIAESGQVAESGSSQSAIRITVEDHGNGIPEAVRNRIFDPFFTTKPRDKGTGLGLSISYSLVKEHSGKVTVESEVGQWTRFHVDLPVAECGLRNGNDLTLNAAAVSKHKFVDIADQDK